MSLYLGFWRKGVCKRFDRMTLTLRQVFVTEFEISIRGANAE